jgi:acetoin utilization protein AcuC
MGMAQSRVALIWDPRLVAYDFGLHHPLAPVRVELTHSLIHAVGLVDGDRVVQVHPGELQDPALLRRHREDFVRAVQRASADPTAGADGAFGLGSGDCPTFPGMHEASRAVCAASVEAARQVWTGASAHAFNPAGGLHHAMPARASGFCVYNDPAIAIDWLLENGAERVCYLDIDVHHGDGVEKMFADDPRVLTISLHESGQFLFPGTGSVSDIGGRSALGSCANLPLLPGTSGQIWLDAFDAFVDPLVRAFQPDVLVSQLGCDTHATDPLAHLALTVDDFGAIVKRVHMLAHEAAGGRWLATGGGGYQLLQVVPRAWTIAFAEMCDIALPPDTPESWQREATARMGERAPARFTDRPVIVPEHTSAAARAAATAAVDELRRTVLRRHGG